jgi:hypothetical protein
MAGLLAFSTISVPVQALAAPGTGSSQKAEHCSNVVFIGARGSGQAYDVGGRFRGLGPEVNKMISVVQSQLHAKGLTYTTDALSYPADSVNDLKPSAIELTLLENPMTVDAELVYYYFHNVRKYLASISTGVSNAIFDMVDYHAVCGPSVFVLAGYSQGAMVMHQAEVTLKTKHPAVFKKIAGTLLLGDGNRVPNTRAKEFGTSTANSEGVQTYLTPMGSHQDVPVPKTTANICNNHDIVCNFNLSNLLNFSASAKVHTSYSHCTKTACTFQRVLTTAATWVGNAVVRLLGG